jgi:pimeloyl-ACP methyl ester carboxylesterase/class 3 adenylate cyclase
MGLGIFLKSPIRKMNVTTETRYARSGRVNIAYQVVGDGPFDLVYVPGWVSNIEMMWHEPGHARFLERLASFSRLILFDKRGTGLSDKVAVSDLPTLDERMDDVRAVMEAVGSERAALFGHSEGGNMAALFAATYPQRTVALITFGVFAKRVWSPDYPWAPTQEEREQFFQEIQRDWGDILDLAMLAPSMQHDENFKRWWASYLRHGASPSDALALAKMNTEIDVREILPTIHVPALIMHRRDDMDARVEEGRYIASRIPNAKYVEFSGADHFPWVGNIDEVLDEIQEFLTGTRAPDLPDTVLGTLLFADIVGSTQLAGELGNARWAALVEQYFQILRRELGRFRGKEVNTTGDGILATFDGPARAVQCGRAMCEAVRSLGINIRVGMHTGEYELVGNEIAGLPIHIAARVLAQAGAGEVWVSSTVKDLIAGSGIVFRDRGMHSLKGVSEPWHLYSVVS